MENIITWFEIPALNFDRAVEFYSNILSIDIQKTDMFGNKMGFFPSNDKNVSGAIVCGKDYKPSMDGTLIYLNGGNDLNFVFSKIEDNNGKILLSKTSIGEENGFIAIFLDTEGNKIGLHSIK